jgi:transcriptional regulator with XRE-family HTH domain
MTPFALRLRALREARGMTLKEMAEGLHVTPAYLSALEHGRRGKPNKRFLHKVCQLFGIIWDEAEELERLAAISHPRVVVDTGGLSAKATEVANRLALGIRDLPEDSLDRILAEILAARDGGAGKPPGTA